MVNLLQERLERDELTMDAQYSALMDLLVSLNDAAKLRETHDMIKKHLRSLKALGENVDQPHFVFLIKSKLPKTVTSRMEEYKDMKEKWTMESIRKALKRYICAPEVGERQTQFIQSPESQDTTVKSQKQKSFLQDGLGSPLLVPYFLEMESLLLMVKNWAAFTVKEMITGVTRVKRIHLLSQERQKSKKLHYSLEAKSSTKRLQGKQAVFSLP